MTKPKPQGYQKINYNNTLLGTFCSSNFNLESIICCFKFL